jgi:hypothetical protein
MQNESMFGLHYWDSVGIAMTLLPLCTADILALDRFQSLLCTKPQELHSH